jgi:hypothetical protein
MKDATVGSQRWQLRGGSSVTDSGEEVRTRQGQECGQSASWGGDSIHTEATDGLAKPGFR